MHIFEAEPRLRPVLDGIIDGGGDAYIAYEACKEAMDGLVGFAARRIRRGGSVYLRQAGNLMGGGRLTKAELQQYRAICAEIEQLERDINDVYRGGMVTDSVQGSSPDAPYVLAGVMIRGLREDAYNRLCGIGAKLSQKMDERIRLRSEIEEFFDALDHGTAAILRGKYVEGLTWRQVAQKLGRTEEGVRKKVERSL